MPQFVSKEEREAYWIRVYEDGGAEYVTMVENWPEQKKQALLMTYRQQRQDHLNKYKDQ